MIFAACWKDFLNLSRIFFSLTRSLDGAQCPLSLLSHADLQLQSLPGSALGTHHQTQFNSLWNVSIVFGRGSEMHFINYNQTFNHRCIQAKCHRARTMLLWSWMLGGIIVFSSAISSVSTHQRVKLYSQEPSKLLCKPAEQMTGSICQLGMRVHTPGEGSVQYRPTEHRQTPVSCLSYHRGKVPAA